MSKFRSLDNFVPSNEKGFCGFCSVGASPQTVVMALFAAVAGIFGMNIPYTWNNGYGYVFKWVMIFK